jgi:hypothetical protein
MKRCPALALLSNGGVPDLRKQIRPGLRERQVSPGRMLRDPAVRDGGFDCRAIFFVAAASVTELPIDDLDRYSPNV